MSPKQPTEQELLKQVLEPLLDDFLYWFERSLKLLEDQDMPFLAEGEQAELVQSIEKAKKEVSTAKILFQATDGQAGIDSKILLPWHNLVARCWDIARTWRQHKENTSTQFSSRN